MKRKFKDIELAATSCMESLTGYEKCLVHNKLLLARSKFLKYENVVVICEAQVAMAKLDVEIATSDIDLLLQELQRGKRFKTDEAIPTMSISTQTGSQPTSSSVSNTSRISFDLPSVDLTSFTKHRSDKSQEPNAHQEANASESDRAGCHGENVQELTTSLRENAQEYTSQGSKDSGYNSSAKIHLISQETTAEDNSLPKCFVSEEILADSPSDNTKEGDTEVVKITKKFKTKKKASHTIDQPKISRKISNAKIYSTEDILPNIETKGKKTNEKPENNHRNSSDNNKGDKKHRDYRHKKERKTNHAKNKSEHQTAQKSNLDRRENTDPRIKKNKPSKTKNESDAVKSKKSEDISCDTTLVIAEEAMEVEMTIPNPRIEDFAKDSPIHYNDFANTILSSVTDASNTTNNTAEGENSQDAIAQSTPFVRRIRTVEHSGTDCQDLPLKVCNNAIIEDQLTTFIRTTLADYNRDVAELCTIGDKTTKINEENISENTAINENTKANDQEVNSRKTDRKSKTPEKMKKNTTKENLIVKIPVTKVPALNQITTKVNQPCLTVTVNDAGAITIRPRSAENSNLPSPKSEKIAVKDRQKTQDKNINSTTLSNLKEPLKTAERISKGQDIMPQSPVKITSRNTKPEEIQTETASYMTDLKDQYYFDVDSPKLADEAPTHKNAVSLFRAFSLLMPPSPTFTVSSSSDKENCSNTPSPPKAQKLPINKGLLDDFVPGTFHSPRNYTITGFKKDIYPSYSSYNSNSCRNDIPFSHRNDFSTSYENDIPTKYKNDVNIRYRNDNPRSCRNDSPISHRNNIPIGNRNDNPISHKNNTPIGKRNDNPISHRNNTPIGNRNDNPISHKNDVNTHYKNNTTHNISNKKPMAIRRTKSISGSTPRRTIKFTEAQPLPVQKPKLKSKINRRKSLDDRAILRILNEPCSSISSKSASPKSSAPTPKKKDLNASSDRLLYSLYKDIRTARCRNFTLKKSKHSCTYCGSVSEDHMCFFSLKTILEQC